MRWLFPIVSLCLLVGCKSNDPNAPVTTAGSRTEAASTAEAGWKEISSAGVAVSFPPDWQAFDLTTSDFNKTMEAAAAKGYVQKEMLDMAKQAASSGIVKLMVLETGGKDPAFTNNANLVVVPAPAGGSMQEIVKQTEQQMKTMAKQGSPVTSRIVSMPAGEVGTIESTLGSDKKTYITFSYIIKHGDKMFVMTYSAPPSEKDKYRQIADKSMNSFRFTGS